MTATAPHAHPHPTPQVRPATAADLEPIAALHTAARAAYLRGRVPNVPFDARAEHARRREAWARVLHGDGTPALCAIRCDRVVGAAAYLPHTSTVREPGATVTLHQLHVDPAHWGTGVGRALHAACLRAWHTAGFTRAGLDVLWHNHRARTFYTRLGWCPDPDRRPAPDATHLALTLTLAPPAPRPASAAS
ncbi:GNAT family N-acetyltransferase [Streptomyces sp. NPDC093707]|uniref:GNAT family N-acetyltransferase n=1 Tax=Streptomyces sp. NPDC093707 TaxID=3154984 RepID=UPI00344E8B4E